MTGHSSQQQNGEHTQQRAAPSSFQPADRVSQFTETVFSEFTQLATKLGSVNLGQGFPDFPVAKFIKDIAASVISSDNPLLNQYSRSLGHPALVKALAEHYNSSSGSSTTTRIQNHQIDPMSEICVTTGATEATFAALQAFVNAGDEVIVFDPAYDAYKPQTLMAGGSTVHIPLVATRSEPRIDSATGKPYYESSDYSYDLQQFKNAITPRTKVVIINTTHNPTGKVFTRRELQQIVDVVKQHPQIVMFDDAVYEELIYDEFDSSVSKDDVPCKLADLAWDQTVSLGSAGKTFSITGWKIGWAIGPQHLIKPISMAHQWIPFCVSTPLQEATAQILKAAAENNFYAELRSTMRSKRDRLFNQLLEAGLTPIKPSSGYFVVAADTSSVFGKQKLQQAIDDYSAGRVKDKPDAAFAKFLSHEIKVTPIPPSAFYKDESWKLAAAHSRFAFCKKDESIDEAVKRLATLQSKDKPTEQEETKEQPPAKEQKKPIETDKPEESRYQKHAEKPTDSKGPHGGKKSDVATDGPKDSTLR